MPTANTGKANWAYISSGTWSLMGVEVQKAALSPRALELNMTNEGGLDGTYRLLKNIMGLWLVQQCKRSFESRGLKYDYGQLMQLASKAKPLRSLVNLNDSRFINPPDMPKAIQAVCRETKQPIPRTEAELIRCCYESLALKYREVPGRTGRADRRNRGSHSYCWRRITKQIAQSICRRRLRTPRGHRPGRSHRARQPPHPSSGQRRIILPRRNTRSRARFE